MVSGPDDPTARSQQAYRDREGRPDPGAVGAGADLDGTGGGTGGAAEPAGQDTGQLQPTAVQGAQGEPAGAGPTARAAPGQSGPPGWRPALAEEPDQRVIAKA